MRGCASGPHLVTGSSCSKCSTSASQRQRRAHSSGTSSETARVSRASRVTPRRDTAIHPNCLRGYIKLCTYIYIYIYIYRIALENFALRARVFFLARRKEARGPDDATRAEERGVAEGALAGELLADASGAREDRRAVRLIHTLSSLSRDSQQPREKRVGYRNAGRVCGRRGGEVEVAFLGPVNQHTVSIRISFSVSRAVSNTR